MLYLNFVTKTFWDQVVKKHVMHTWEVAAHLGRLKHAADVCSSHFRMPSEACQTTPRLNVRYQTPTMASVTYLWKDFVKAASRSHWGFFGTALSCNTFLTHLHLCVLLQYFSIAMVIISDILSASTTTAVTKSQRLKLFQQLAHHTNCSYGSMNAQTVESKSNSGKKKKEKRIPLWSVGNFILKVLHYKNDLIAFCFIRPYRLFNPIL